MENTASSDTFEQKLYCTSYTLGIWKTGIGDEHFYIGLFLLT